jgi:hypothetical protein
MYKQLRSKTMDTVNSQNMSENQSCICQPTDMPFVQNKTHSHIKQFYNQQIAVT